MLDTPAQPLDVEVDLKPGTPPAWVGTISIPAQNLKAFPLSVEVQGTSVSFVMANVPGTPTFKGTLAADGATISGDFSQGGGSIPFKLTRKGDAVIAPPAKSTADHQGARRHVERLAGGRRADPAAHVEAGQRPRRGDGHASSASIRAASRSRSRRSRRRGRTSRSNCRRSPAQYSGDLKDGKLVGTWTQGPGSAPLEFTRATP